MGERAGVAGLFPRVLGNYTVRLTTTWNSSQEPAPSPKRTPARSVNGQTHCSSNRVSHTSSNSAPKTSASQIESTYGIPPYLKNSCLSLYMNTGTIAKGVAFHQHRQTWGWLLAGRKVWYVAPSGDAEVSAPQARGRGEAAERRRWRAALSSRRGRDRLPSSRLVARDFQQSRVEPGNRWPR